MRSQWSPVLLLVNLVGMTFLRFMMGTVALGWRTCSDRMHQLVAKEVAKGERIDGGVF